MGLITALITWELWSVRHIYHAKCMYTNQVTSAFLSGNKWLMNYFVGFQGFYTWVVICTVKSIWFECTLCYVGFVWVLEM